MKTKIYVKQHFLNVLNIIVFRNILTHQNFGPFSLMVSSFFENCVVDGCEFLFVRFVFSHDAVEEKGCASEFWSIVIRIRVLNKKSLEIFFSTAYVFSLHRFFSTSRIQLWNGIMQSRIGRIKIMIGNLIA